MIFLRLLTVMLCLLSFSASWAEDPPSPTSQQESQQTSPIVARLLAENQSIEPGRSFWVAVHLKIDDEWHAYWKNPGGVGFPTSIVWDLPPGFKASEIYWPIPERLVQPMGVNYGYTDDVWLLIEITPPEALPVNKNVSLKAEARWLVCSDTACLPGESSMTVALPVKNATPEPNPRLSEEFGQARERIPQRTENLQAQWKQDYVELSLPLNTWDDEEASFVYFCPESPHMVDEAEVVEWKKMKDHYVVTVKATDKIDALKGTLVVQSGEDKARAWDIEAPIYTEEVLAFADMSKVKFSPESVFEPHRMPAFEGGFVLALAFAFLGGMLLNLMPCVLPVISLKIFSFVKMSGESRSLILKHGLSFSLGVLMSFWALAGLLLLLRAYGHSVGWGFQLQEPMFVAVLASVLMVFALSFFGVFEIGTLFASWAGQTQSDARHAPHALLGSFFSGVLATAVATPCTGPFLGSAIGFAVTLSAPMALLIFTSLGLGMAFPYLLFSASPKLIKFLPKPGAWMVTFKELMGFFMLATSLWLVWVFGAQTSLLSVFLVLVGFLSISMGCWVYGKWGTPIHSRVTRWMGILVALLFGILGSYVIVMAAQFAPGESASGEIAAAIPIGGELDRRSIRKWEPFSAARLADLQKQNIPVLIDFTAKWCLICQTNHLILSMKEVSDKLEEKGVVKMLADWTKNDPAITAELQKFGRSGVPLYILYGNDPSKQPYILPQVLTPEVILDYLDKIEKAPLKTQEVMR